MFSSVTSGTVYGMKSYLVNVEVDFSQGLPCVVMVGKLGSEVKESAERVRVALKNIGISLPAMHIAINLSPADIKKSGTGFDLPIALGILEAMGKIPPGSLKNTLSIGELGLNGEIKKVNAVMPIVWEGAKQGYKTFIVPCQNIKEADLVPDIDVVGKDTLLELIDFLKNQENIVRKPHESGIGAGNEAGESLFQVDFADVVGQDNLKRGALIAAAGFHHLLIMGSPGTGKTMIAKRIPTILPPLTKEERMDVTAIYSIAGKLTDTNPVIRTRPFVSPHHTVSIQGMAGGGMVPKPGAVSLAHKGILFLDELPEFQRQSIDILRQPLEEKTINLSRSTGSFSYPADIMLVAAMNPCPCGYYPDINKCSCSPASVKTYLQHISGPILDRIDICVTAMKINVSDFHDSNTGMTSMEMRKIVEKTRVIQNERYKDEPYDTNSGLDIAGIKKYCSLEEVDRKLFESACDKLDISARAYHRILRVARTIADIGDSEKIRSEHLMEAMCYRPQLPG